jgi:hypothetical protein
MCRNCDINNNDDKDQDSFVEVSQRLHPELQGAVAFFLSVPTLGCVAFKFR